jgi:hypothetical protein
MAPFVLRLLPALAGCTALLLAGCPSPDTERGQPNKDAVSKEEKKGDNKTAEPIPAVNPEPQKEPSIKCVTPMPSTAISLQDVVKQPIRELKITADPSIELNNCTDIAILSCDVKSIRLFGCKRIRVCNCWIHDSPKVAVNVDGCEDVLIQGNRMERVSSGVWAHKSTKVQVVGNYVEDVVGPMPRGQLAQFDKVSGKDNVIRGNFGVNHRGKSSPEDMISLYQSTGTAESPILIENNYLGGDPKEGSSDKSKSGSGIMLGDSGGEHLLCRRNIVVSPGQVGIGVAGGNNITVEDNTVIGTKSNVSNVGISVWNQTKEKGGKVTVRSNKVAWINKDDRPNPYWHGGGFSEVIDKDNQFGLADLFHDVPSPPTTPPLPPIPYGKTVSFPWK